MEYSQIEKQRALLDNAVINFDTISDLQDNDGKFNIDIGDIVYIKGYYNIADSCGHYRTRVDDTYTGLDAIVSKYGNRYRVLCSGTIKVSTLGIKNDISLILNDLIANQYARSFDFNINVSLNSPLTVRPSTTIYSSNRSVVTISNGFVNFDKSLMFFTEFVNIHDIDIICTDNEQDVFVYNDTNVANSTFKNLTIRNCNGTIWVHRGPGVYTQAILYKDINVINCKQVFRTDVSINKIVANLISIKNFRRDINSNFNSTVNGYFMDFSRWGSVEMSDIVMEGTGGAVTDYTMNLSGAPLSNFRIRKLWMNHINQGMMNRIYIGSDNVTVSMDNLAFIDISGKYCRIYAESATVENGGILINYMSPESKRYNTFKVHKVNTNFTGSYVNNDITEGIKVGGDLGFHCDSNLQDYIENTVKPHRILYNMDFMNVSSLKNKVFAQLFSSSKLIAPRIISESGVNNLKINIPHSVSAEGIFECILELDKNFILNNAILYNQLTVSFEIELKYRDGSVLNVQDVNVDDKRKFVIKTHKNTIIIMGETSFDRDGTVPVNSFILKHFSGLIPGKKVDVYLKGLTIYEGFGNMPMMADNIYKWIIIRSFDTPNARARMEKDGILNDFIEYSILYEQYHAPHVQGVSKLPEEPIPSINLQKFIDENMWKE